jgi:predicted nucleotide-binding protein (sugar kinase/HSP70/actin superfamily)
MKIGIPRALLYYYYYPFWKILFDSLNIETVVSPSTTEAIINKGIEFSVPEICVPIKVFTGHVAELIEKDVDYVLVPRMISISKNEYFCPKFMGLPDMIKYTVPGAADKILSPSIKSSSDSISNPKYYKEFKDIFGINFRDLRSALKTAEKGWQNFRQLSKQGHILTDVYRILEGEEISSQNYKQETGVDVTVGLLGYVYDVYDEYISMDIIDRLKKLGVNVITFEMLDEKEILNSIKFMKKHLFWTFSNKLLGAGYYFYNNPKVDGIIHVTAFNCGPDSIIGKILEIDSYKYKKPFMTIRVDEHTGENHLLTRIEAFVDMIRRKKIKKLGDLNHEDNLSIYGNTAGI